MLCSVLHVDLDSDSPDCVNKCGACSERSGLQEAPSAPPGVVEWKAAKHRASVRQTGCLCLTFSIQMSFNFIVLRRVYEAENEPIWLWNQISVTNNKSNNTSDCQRAQQQQHWLTAGWATVTMEPPSKDDSGWLIGRTEVHTRPDSFSVIRQVLD